VSLGQLPFRIATVQEVILTAFGCPSPTFVHELVMIVLAVHAADMLVASTVIEERIASQTTMSHMDAVFLHTLTLTTVIL
jgi:hypothetical protein